MLAASFTLISELNNMCSPAFKVSTLVKMYKYIFLLTGTDIKFDVPVTFERKHSPGQWCAYYERNIPDQLNVCVSVFSPADATIAVYRLDLVLMSFPVLYTHMVGNITLLCNPWCTGKPTF